MGHHASKVTTDENNNEEAKIGGSFTSKMTGHLFKSGSQHPCDFIITIETGDVVAMLASDERHEATISGQLSCDILSDAPIPFSGGKFYNHTSKSNHIEFRSMIYEAAMEWGGKEYFLKGIAVSHEGTFIKDDDVRDSFEIDMVIKEGSDFQGNVVTTGRVETKLAHFAKDLTEIEISGCDYDEALHLEWKAKFGYFLGGSLLDLSNIFSPNEFCPESIARERRALDLNGVEPEIYQMTANDGVPLVLTRYKCGTKGPILFLHGLCVTGRIFSLDTIDESAVEYFCKHGYDMWVLELRYSVCLPSHHRSMHINDAAENDVPPVIDFILETTESPDLQVFAHCIGSLTMHVSLFGGHVDRKKVRSMVVSQAGFCMNSSSMNHAKANLHIDTLATAVGFDGLTAYTGKHEHPREKLISALGKLLSKTTLNDENQCDSEVCHRITVMFGLMWEHANLNDLTHETLTEWFGFGHADFYKHLAVSFRKGRLTDLKGHDAYIPDFDAKDRLESVRYRKAMENLDIPILYFVGSANKGWDINSTRQSYIRCLEANPRQHYEWFEVPDYGHLDCIVGKRATTDVYPRILPFLDKYSTPVDSQNDAANQLIM